MIEYLFDILFVLIVGGVGWFVAGRGAVKAAMILFAVLLSSLFSIGTFEFLGRFIQRVYLTRSESHLEDYTGFFALLMVFTAVLSALLFLGYKLVSEPMELGDRLETATRWSLGILTGYLFSAFFLTAIQTFPASRDFGGAFPPQAEKRAGPIMRMAPDYQYLGIVEHSIGRAFAVKQQGWTFESPLVPIRTYGDRWPSFVSRYALWRELIDTQWDDVDNDEPE